MLFLFSLFWIFPCSLSSSLKKIKQEEVKRMILKKNVWIDHRKMFSFSFNILLIHANFNEENGCIHWDRNRTNFGTFALSLFYMVLNTLKIHIAQINVQKQIILNLYFSSLGILITFNMWDFSFVFYLNTSLICWLLRLLSLRLALSTQCFSCVDVIRIFFHLWYSWQDRA